MRLNSKIGDFALMRRAPQPSVATISGTTHTLSVLDVGRLLRFTSNSSISVTLPVDDHDFAEWLEDDEIALEQAGSGQITVAGATAVAATGNLLFAALPANHSTIKFNGTVITFHTSGATGDDVNIGVDIAATVDALVSKLNASVDAQISKCTYTGTGSPTHKNLHIVNDTAGAAGNLFTVVAADAVNAAPTQQHLLGGKDGVTVNTRTVLKTVGQYGIVRLRRIGANQWVMHGDLAAS